MCPLPTCANRALPALPPVQAKPTAAGKIAGPAPKARRQQQLEVGGKHEVGKCGAAELRHELTKQAPPPACTPSLCFPAAPRLLTCCTAFPSDS